MFGSTTSSPFCPHWKLKSPPLPIRRHETGLKKLYVRKGWLQFFLLNTCRRPSHHSFSVPDQNQISFVINPLHSNFTGKLEMIIREVTTSQWFWTLLLKTMNPLLNTGNLTRLKAVILHLMYVVVFSWVGLVWGLYSGSVYRYFVWNSKQNYYQIPYL